MNMERLLSEASWRLRAFLASPDLDGGRVGCRGDDLLCPVAEWLFAETGAPIFVDEEWIVTPSGSWATPPVLGWFARLVDAARFASDTDAAADFRISREEAFAALAAAEAEADRHVLPVVAESLPRCAYCWRAASTPVLHCFIEQHPTPPEERPTRENCVPFVGRLCDEHVRALTLVGGAPAIWWQADENETHSHKQELIEVF